MDEKRREPTIESTELRRQAEEAWRERKKKTGPLPATEPDLRHLVHELEVHQIQLEMQNEELARSRAEVEALLSRYTDLYDFAPVGYFSLDRDGTILQLNLTGANLLGIERKSLVKRRLGVFISYQSILTFNSFLGKVLKSPQKESCEIQLLKDGGETIWVNIDATADTSDPQRPVCRAAVMDITLRKQAEEKLIYLSSHDELTGLYNRSFFMEELARLERGRAFPISIVMADVDKLKATNDREGHAAGDALLIRAGQLLTDTFRAEDVVGRIGGDEFAVLLPNTDVTAAADALERLREVIRKNNAAHPGSPISISLGMSVAKYPTDLSVTMQEADEDMYRMKRGRNTS